MKKRQRRNSAEVMSAIFLVALGARLLNLIIDPLLQRDAVLYLFMAEQWKETGDYAQTIVGGTVIPPFPLFTVMKLIDLGLSPEVAGRSIALFLGSLIPVLGYHISCLLFKNALVSGINVVLFIFHPTLISYSIQPLRENYYLFFCGLTGVALIKGIKSNKLKDWTLCGAFLSFCLFSRYESLELLALCPLVLLCLVAGKKKELQKAFSSLCVFFLSTIITSIFLLSIVDYDLSFITKTKYYSNKIIQQYNVRGYFQADSENDE